MSNSPGFAKWKKEHEEQLHPGIKHAREVGADPNATWEQIHQAYTTGDGSRAVTTGHTLGQTEQAYFDRQAIAAAQQYAERQSMGQSTLAGGSVGNIYGGPNMGARTREHLAAQLAMGANQNAAAQAALAQGQAQGTLGGMVRARAMGQGPSLADAQAMAARDQVARQSAAAASSGGMLGLRGAMGYEAQAGGSLAAQVAQARGAEQAQAAGLYGQNLGAMRSANLSAMGEAQQRNLEFKQYQDSLDAQQAGFETRRDISNLEAEDAMRDRMLRAQLAAMGRADAAANQAMARKGAITSAIVGGATNIAGGAYGAFSNAYGGAKSGKGGG